MTTAKNILEARGLTKSFGSFKAVDDISLSFESGLIHAVIGENGAGKSTLMKLLFGLYQPTQGEIRLEGQPIAWSTPMLAIRHGLGMVQQHFSLVGNLSVIDNIMLGAERTKAGIFLNREAAIAHLQKVLPTGSLTVPWHIQAQDLSVGQRQKVEILKLLFRDARILFLDEPTAVLTPQEIEEFFSVLKLLKGSGRTIVLITHKIGEVFRICDTYAVLRQGRLTGRGFIQETTPQGLVESMVGRKLEPLSEDRKAPRNQQALTCKNVSTPQRLRDGLKNISFNVKSGEIVGIAGVEGAGQSALVDCLMGLVEFSGEIILDRYPIKRGSTAHLRKAGLGVIPEDRLHQGLWAAVSCTENMLIGLENRFSSFGLLQKDKLVKKAREWAAKYDVRASSLDVRVGSLSGGNQQKMIFAREIEGHQPRFMICHQPTRGVDLGAIDTIYRTLINLRAQDLAVLLISSELDELLTLSDRILVFFEGRITGEFTRNHFDRMKIGAAMTGAKA